MPRVHSLAAVRARLEHDRVWAAFSLADLEPEHQPYTHWFTGASTDALVLVYRRFDPPIVFCQGAADDVGAILDEPEVVSLTASAHFNVMPALEPAVRARFRAFDARPMVRMVMPASGVDLPSPSPMREVEPTVERLGPSDLDQVLALYADEPPAFFLPMLLEVGVYYGVRDNGVLVAIAGTHVISVARRVGTIGNVHTRPDYRRRGLAGALTRAVSRELTRMGASTVVLNVVAENVVARRVYTRIGFEEYCGYLDGNAAR